MLKSLNFRQKILIGYALPVCALFGAAGFGWMSAQRVFHIFDIIHDADELLKESDQVELSTSRLIQTVRGYLLIQEPRFLSQYSEAKRLFNQSISKLQESQYFDPDQVSRIQMINRLTTDYIQMADQMIRLSQAGQQNEAIELIRLETSRQLTDDFTQLDLELDQSIRQMIEMYQADAENALDRLVMGLILSAVLLGGIALALAWWIVKQVSDVILQSTQMIVSSSSEIATTIEQQERTANQQAASVNETTTTMDELSTSSQQSRQQADQATVIAEDVQTLAEQGNQSAETILQEMHELHDQVLAIATQITNLNEKAHQISNISKLVSDIANQTNLLALNAAVEAVRAGEQGKGFTVVATEIRKLADQSKQSAADIRTLVLDIQTAANSTVIATQAGTQTVETSIQVTQNTASTFAKVAESINQIVINNRQISLNVEQQAIATQQVATFMGELNQGVQETAAGIRQTRVGTRQLNQAALDLNRLIAAQDGARNVQENHLVG
jgi:methyl-accepting chemotaxis protein